MYLCGKQEDVWKGRRMFLKAGGKEDVQYIGMIWEREGLMSEKENGFHMKK